MSRIFRDTSQRQAACIWAEDLEGQSRQTKPSWSMLLMMMASNYDDFVMVMHDHGDDDDVDVDFGDNGG